MLGGSEELATSNPEDREGSRLRRTARIVSIGLLGGGLSLDILMPVNIHIPILYLAAVAASVFTVSSTFLTAVAAAAMLASLVGMLGPAAIGDAPAWLHMVNRSLVLVTIAVVGALGSMTIGILRELREREGELQLRAEQVERLLIEQSAALSAEGRERQSVERRLSDLKQLENTGRAALDRSDELTAMIDLSVGNLQILAGRLSDPAATEFKPYVERAILASRRAATIIGDWTARHPKIYN